MARASRCRRRESDCGGRRKVPHAGNLPGGEGRGEIRRSIVEAELQPGQARNPGRDLAGDGVVERSDRPLHLRQHRLQDGPVRGHLDEGERPIAEGFARERVIGQGCDGHAGKDVGGQEREHGGLQEPADGIGEVELHGALVDRRGLDLGPGRGHRPGVVRVVEDVHRVHHVAARHRHAVVPDRVPPQVERPAGALLAHRPSLGEVREDRVAGTEPDEAAEEERHEVAVRLRSGRQRRDRRGAAEDALHVAKLGGCRGCRGGRRSGLERRHRDRHREDGQDGHEREGDASVAPVHHAYATAVVGQLRTPRARRDSSPARRPRRGPRARS